MKLWIVGIALNDKGTEWAFSGVFDDEKKAIVECKTEMYFIGPAILNQVFSQENVIDWPHAYYPLIEGGK